MAKVVYVTPELQFEVQRWDQEECFGDYYETLSGAWVPVERAATRQHAETMAQVLQSRNTLEKYRVVDTFQPDEEGE